MSQDRLFRSDEAAAFDWYRPARELDVSVEIARSLYARAMQRAADSDLRRAEALYLGWLRDAAQHPALISPPPPGRKTLVMRETEKASKPWHLQDFGRLDPGRSTRALLEAGDDRDASPGLD